MTKSWIKLYTSVGISVWLLALGGPLIAKEKKFDRPPYSGFYEPQDLDERGLWSQLDQLEKRFRDAPFIVNDPKLTEWVHEVLCKTVGRDRCNSIRTYIIRDTNFNAFMAPNGMMGINTGALARLHSESELAALLGHEFAHFEKRHSLNKFKRGRSLTDALAWISLAGAATGTRTGYLQNSLVGTFYSFNRSQEEEADILGAEYVKGSEYRLNASNMWKRLMLEEDARREERKRRKTSHSYTGWLDSHPANLKRATYLSDMEELFNDDGEMGLRSYREHAVAIMPELLDALIKRNDFGGANYIITSRAETMGWDGQLLFARAELYRNRGNPRDLSTASELYSEASKYSDCPPEAWRGLGLSELRLGRPEKGKEALRKYLKHLPEAKDATIIKAMLE